jgi:hypothetical protein
MKMSIVSTGQRSEKLCRPGATIAAIQRQALIDLQGVIGRKRDQKPIVAHLQDIFVIAYAIETIPVSDLILMNENLVGPFERWRNNETSTLVIQAGQDDRS